MDGKTKQLHFCLFAKEKIVFPILSAHSFDMELTFVMNPISFAVWIPFPKDSKLFQVHYVCKPHLFVHGWNIAVCSTSLGKASVDLLTA